MRRGRDCAEVRPRWPQRPYRGIGTWTDRDEVDVLAETGVDQMGLTERCPAEEDHVIRGALGQGSQNVRDCVVTAYLVI